MFSSSTGTALNTPAAAAAAAAAAAYSDVELPCKKTLCPEVHSSYSLHDDDALNISSLS